MSVIRDLRVLETKRHEVNLKDYVDLVKRAAKGEIQADEELIDSIERTGKTVHEFQSDVETLTSRREAAQGLVDAESMNEEIEKAHDIEKAASDTFHALEEEYRKNREAAKRSLSEAMDRSSHLVRTRSRIIQESITCLNATVDPTLLEEVASVESEISQLKDRLHELNMFNASHNPQAEDWNGSYAKQQRERDELQELIPQLEAKLEALEKQKHDPERMRWTEGVE